MSIYFELEDLPKRYQEQIKGSKKGKAAKVLEQLEPKQPKEAKYHNKKAEVDGIIFDSEKESVRYAELKALEKYGQIHDLQLQVPFELIPKQLDENGKVIERACIYKADFVYIDKKGNKVVEDVKSKATKTDVYAIKRKLMMYRYGIRITEV